MYLLHLIIIVLLASLPQCFAAIAPDCPTQTWPAASTTIAYNWQSSGVTTLTTAGINPTITDTIYNLQYAVPTGSATISGVSRGGPCGVATTAKCLAAIPAPTEALNKVQFKYGNGCSPINWNAIKLRVTPGTRVVATITCVNAFSTTFTSTATVQTTYSAIANSNVAFDRCVTFEIGGLNQTNQTLAVDDVTIARSPNYAPVWVNKTASAAPQYAGYRVPITVNMTTLDLDYGQNLTWSGTMSSTNFPDNYGTIQPCIATIVDPYTTPNCTLYYQPLGCSQTLLNWVLTVSDDRGGSNSLSFFASPNYAGSRNFIATVLQNTMTYTSPQMWSTVAFETPAALKQATASVFASPGFSVTLNQTRQDLLPQGIAQFRFRVSGYGISTVTVLKTTGIVGVCGSLSTSVSVNIMRSGSFVLVSPSSSSYAAGEILDYTYRSGALDATDLVVQGTALLNMTFGSGNSVLIEGGAWSGQMQFFYTVPPTLVDTIVSATFVSTNVIKDAQGYIVPNSTVTNVKVISLGAAATTSSTSSSSSIGSTSSSATSAA
jgi:hypothetical protein